MPTRLEKLQARRTDSAIRDARGLNEVYARLNQTEAVRYAIGAMQPVEDVYTRNTYAQGDRIIEQLKARLNETCSYKYQGSVTNNTHIKARSDLDLLTITEKFTTLQPPQPNPSPYQGNPIADLRSLRTEIISSLRAAFPTATVTPGSKSVPIEGGSLTRKIDVVPCNWYDTLLYAQYNSDVFRGVYILDNDTGTRLPNTPFYHNILIDVKDDKTAGGMRKAARLMKSLKYDADRVDLASYDIVSIAYNMEDHLLNVGSSYDLAIVSSCQSYCERLQNDQALRESIEVPDGHRKVFTAGHATLAGLNQLTAELGRLSLDVLNENRRSFQKLAEARVAY